MATGAKFNIFVKDLAHKVHNLSADDLRFVLSNTAPSAANTVFSDITEIATGNGYSAGGIVASLDSSDQTGGLYKLILDDMTLTATGGSIGPFRYIALYNNTPGSKPLIARWDHGSAVTLASGESFVLDADATNGVVNLQ